MAGQAHRGDLLLIWRHVTDWAKHRPLVLQVAERLGRGRGRMRLFDEFDPLPRAPHIPDLSGWAGHELAAVWIGHATVLLRIGGLTILTDPVLSHRIGLGLGLITGGPHRLVAPALSARQLPPLDLILVSHAHLDHLDRPTLNRLPKDVPVITSECNADLIADLGFRRVRELRWGEGTDLSGVRITAGKAVHWGARTVFDEHRACCSFVIEAGRRRVLYGGDTAYGDQFRTLGKVDLAILGIGGYNPWIEGHATPEQTWAMANHARADFILPMHHSTFRLSHEPVNEPLERLFTVSGQDRDRIAVQEMGRVWTPRGCSPRCRD